MGRAGVSTSSANEWEAPMSSSTETCSSKSPSPVAQVRKKSRVDVQTRLKKSQRKQQTSAAGSWPCKIHGCNAQFAREADLKRHQRTTKQHSMPSFSCPQCDAAFTRTDALRRHQKSRHGGVIEPIEMSNEQNSGSWLSTKTKDKSCHETLPVQLTQNGTTHAGSSSYYRSHTANISPYIPPRLQQQQPKDTQFTHPIRTFPWPACVPVWFNGAITPTYNAASQPSPHYRPHTGSYPTPRPPDGVIIRDPVDPSKNASAQPPSEKTAPYLSPPALPCIDDTSDENDPGRLTTQKELTADDVVAVLEAALRQAAHQSGSGSEDFSPESSPSSGFDHRMEEELMDLCVLRDYDSERSSMDTILNTKESMTP